MPLVRAIELGRGDFFRTTDGEARGVVMDVKDLVDGRWAPRVIVIRAGVMKKVTLHPDVVVDLQPKRRN